MSREKSPLWYESRYVRIERVRPLVEYLEGSYGCLRKAAEGTGIPYRTLQGIKRVGKNNYVTRKVARKVVQSVISLRHGDRTWSIYENEGPPRRATPSEEYQATHRERWSFPKDPVSRVG